ncbi:hypothetical protein FH972_023161 [Carpinus fangiana]|uniref:Amine oxidase domain-containing protein n=1 Tax=Carpinus fangiana TaxID=176857 RepID=A0A5N6KUV6_9ROSI|nr:hypothetical protein FH972_023161 [Carpinus fangiana]
MMTRKRVAIVGSGCAGLGALWALKNSNYEVHLFEADERLGGHTNTVTFRNGENECQVDTGFIVYNMATYPNLIRFLSHENVDSAPTAMTFGVSRDNGLFEWAGTSLGAVFAQRRNLWNPAMWRMIYDIVRFNQCALDLLHFEQESENNPVGANGISKSVHKPSSQQTMGEYLDQEGYSQSFRDNYLVPMTAAVWSTTPDKCSLHFPIMTLVRFMWNHHLLSTVATRPDWMTVCGGSQKYVDAILQNFPKENIHVNKPVTGVEDINGKIIVQFEEDEELFDHVILACHGDQALRIIEDGATQEERNILEAFTVSENRAILHSDLNFMPKSERAWSAWNLLFKSTKTSSNGDQVCLTYNMNILQHISRETMGHVLVTLNPQADVDPHKIQGQWTYYHPLYTPEAINAQKQLHRIQNTRNISYAGAWTKYGFHEDGFSSGLKVAIDHLGAELPFDFVDSTFSRGRRPQFGYKDLLVRAILWQVGWLIWWVELFCGICGWPLGYAASFPRRTKVE